MADFFSKFKWKTRGNSSGSSNDSYSTREKPFSESHGEDIFRQKKLMKLS